MFDYSGIPFRVVNWVPVIHAPAAYLKSGKRTVPFIVVSNGAKRLVVRDSTKIIEWVNTCFAPLELMPDDNEAYRETMAFEERADGVGNDVIRYMYAPMIEQPDDFIAVWGWGAKPIHRRLLRLGLPIVRSLLDRHLDFSSKGREAGLSRLHDFFSELDERLQDGRAYLVGDRLSIADISVASLMAPVYAPELHPVYSSAPFCNTLVEQRSQFKHYASFTWMLQLYAGYRSHTAAKTSVYIG